MQVEYDPNFDVLTIEGKRYSGALFRELGLQTRPGAVIRILPAKTADYVTVYEYQLGQQLDELMQNCLRGDMTRSEAVNKFVTDARNFLNEPK